MLDEKSYTPRWVILMLDLFLSSIALLIAYYIKFNFKFESSIVEDLSISLLVLFFLNAIFFILIKPYAGTIRHFHADDLNKIMLSLFLSHFILLVVNIVGLAIGESLFISNVVLAFSYLCSIFFLTSTRLFIRFLLRVFKNIYMSSERIILLGKINSCISVKSLLEVDQKKNYTMLGIFDYKSKKANGISAENLNLLNYDELVKKIVHKQTDKIYFCDTSIPNDVRLDLVDICLDYEIIVFDVPVKEFLENGIVSLGERVRKINIEELLGRETIKIKDNHIQEILKNKTVMVTGGAGSIGSEIISQLITHKAKKIVLLDIAETPIYELKSKIEELGISDDIFLHIVNVKDKERLNIYFEKYKPDFVFHSAAYKHVPLMEENPIEAFTCNVLGTVNVANCALEYGVEKMVYVSTDKAVNPTNVMGASKRLAEIYVQSLNNHIANKKLNKTKYITTRFGNVLGSNGSVIPKFNKQIEMGGPITLTHPKINRYFMTIPEACRLVFEAAIMGGGGEIYIFKMGKSIKIIDLAYKMIKLSGLIPEKDIKIVYTGLRPGEKLFEELLNKKENTIPTHHEKILIAKVRKYDFEKVEQEYKLMSKYAHENNELELVKTMKKIVPEYISNNSKYEELDKIKSLPK